MALSCLLETGFTKADSCSYGLNKIEELYIANFTDVTATELGEGDDELASITMKSSAKWYKYEPAKDTASYSDNLVVAGSGAKYRAQTIGFTISGAYDSDMLDRLHTLSLGRFMVAALLSNGTKVLFGRNTPLEADADGANLVGEASADGTQGITVSLTCNSNEEALPISAAAWKTIVGE